MAEAIEECMVPGCHTLTSPNGCGGHRRICTDGSCKISGQCLFFRSSLLVNKSQAVSDGVPHYLVLPKEVADYAGVDEV